MNRKNIRQRPRRGSNMFPPLAKSKKLDLSLLDQEFPFKWRVQSYSQYSNKATAVPYCDARQVQDVFDKVCGKENWQCEFEDVGGNNYCHIGIKIDGEWVWKSDCGTESNVEKEKGEASDSFKRAGSKWGVGRFLYGVRPYTLTTSKKKEKGDTPAQLYCVDKGGNKIADWFITDYINAQRGTTKPVPGANPETKTPEDKSSIQTTFEDWVKKYPVPRILRALTWYESNKEYSSVWDEKRYKKEGINVCQSKFAAFCHLIKITAFDDDLIDMCLEGRDYKSIAEFGIWDVIQKEETEKLLDDCILVDKQSKNNE